MTQWFDVAIQVFTFLAVVGMVNLTQRAVSAQLAVRRRLGREETSPSEGSVLKADKVSNPFLLWVQSATAGGQVKETQKLRRDLSLAGFDQPSAPIWYVILRFSLAIGLPMGLIGGLALAGRPLTGLGAFMFPLVLCGLGLIAPKALLDNRINARREQLEHEFPDALDLMVVCVEAGLGLEAAFVRVAAEVTESHPRIAQEFGRLADELGAGRGRAEALRALAERVNVDSIRSFVALLIQTDLLGVSIAQSLRTYSAEMRESRFMKAEEKAMRIPVLMTMPIVACFMPVIIVALLLPPAIDVVRTLVPALAGR
ncbi:type II secretion system F family protein [Phenylobacterium sp.]|uniref:type II secretion system F family protein n=1 Tax=Phenylobacterium sp. TaxID=1871053 RepID=UPI0028A2D3D1|nr:type II secretion system F family protein [Phenylobacterium sp.]